MAFYKVSQITKPLSNAQFDKIIPTKSENNDSKPTINLIEFYSLYKIGHIKIFYMIVLFLILYFMDHYYFHSGSIIILLAIVVIVSVFNLIEFITILI